MEGDRLSEVLLYSFNILAFYGFTNEFTKCPAYNWLDSSVGKALYRYRRGHGFESRSSTFFFSGFLFSTAKVEYITAINVHLLKNFSHRANVCNFIHSLHIKHLYLSDKPLNTVNYPRPRKFYKTLRKTLECTHSSSASSL